MVMNKHEHDQEPEIYIQHDCTQQNKTQETQITDQKDEKKKELRRQEKTKPKQC